jgi:RNA polymerase sigma factor (sigma-70 family)
LLLSRDWNAERDDELLAYMACGEEEERHDAFEAFYERHKQYLYGICHSVLKSFGRGIVEVDDLFQATMLKARDGADTFRTEGETDRETLEDMVDAWLGRIAENVLIDWLRRRPSVVPLDAELSERLELEGNGGTEFKNENDEEHELIREAVESLSPKEQAVIWTDSLFYERRKHKRIPSDELDEIVSTLGMTKDSFRKTRERARKKIREYMRDFGPRKSTHGTQPKK